MAEHSTKVESNRKQLVDCSYSEYGLLLEYEDENDGVYLSPAGARQLRDWLNSIDLGSPRPAAQGVRR